MDKGRMPLVLFCLSILKNRRICNASPLISRRIATRCRHSSPVPPVRRFSGKPSISLQRHILTSGAKSGDAYILHPCSVAKILAEEMDILNPEILAAALLHDTVEDVEEVTAEVVGKKFGSYVQAIVEGCTKVTHVSGDSQLDHKRTHRKIFSGAALRPEVMLVKLADRLHNLRTLKALPERKRQRIADETIDIYAPSGHRLRAVQPETRDVQSGPVL